MAIQSQAGKTGRWPVLLLMLAGVGIASPVMAGSIFDDDYNPPQREMPKPDIQPAPADQSPTPAQPAPTPAPPIGVPADPAPAVNTPRRVIPKAEQAKCRLLFKQTFASELKDRSPIARKKLSKFFLAEASKSTGAPIDYFVLLTGALESAEESGSARLSFQAIDLLAGAYQLDGLAAKTDAAAKIWASATASTSIANVQATLDLFDKLVAEDDFVTASRIAALLQRGAANIRDPELKAAVTSHIRDFEAARTGRDKFVANLAKLKGAPDDQSANFAVGSYLCFTRAQWEKGLGFLAKGNDAALKSLAAQELSRGSDDNATAIAGDGWWDAAQKMPPANRAKTLEHAVSLYRTAAVTLAGVKKLAIEKRISAAPTNEFHQRIDLLDSFDQDLDVVNGKWQMQDGTLSSDQTTASRVEFRYEPPEEYDLRVSFVEFQDHDVNVICLGGGRQFLWMMQPTICGFDSVHGVGVDKPANPTGKRNKRWIGVGQHYTTLVKVRKNGVEAYLNDQLVSSWKTDYSDMGLWDGFALHRRNSIGLALGTNIVKFDLVELVEVTGQGKEIE